MSFWERNDPGIVRVEQADWDNPNPGTWVAKLERFVRQAATPVILAAHSCGVSTLQRWAQPGESRIIPTALECDRSGKQG
jgi:predicted alpha/beta hydrolase family esterase